MIRCAPGLVVAGVLHARQPVELATLRYIELVEGTGASTAPPAIDLLLPCADPEARVVAAAKANPSAKATAVLRKIDAATATAPVAPVATGNIAEQPGTLKGMDQ
jgi:hypothetical protein